MESGLDRDRTGWNRSSVLAYSRFRSSDPVWSGFGPVNTPRWQHFKDIFVLPFFVLKSAPQARLGAGRTEAMAKTLFGVQAQRIHKSDPKGAPHTRLAPQAPHAPSEVKLSSYFFFLIMSLCFEISLK